MRKAILLVLGFAVLLWCQDSTVTNNSEQIQAQLNAANERIAQLEGRIKLITLQFQQQQGIAQFYQAGQALCELDKQPAAKTASVAGDHK